MIDYVETRFHLSVLCLSCLSMPQWLPKEAAYMTEFRF